MAVLVTGGAGYIGSQTVRLLRERGREVVVLDSMEFGHRAAVGDVPLVKGDVGDSEVVAETGRAVRHRLCHPLRGLQVTRRVDDQAAAILRKQRGRQYPALGNAARGRGGSARVLLDLCRVRDARTGAGGGGRPRPTREPLRGEQGDDREGSELVRPVPGPAVREPALLQRRRRVARRVDRGGLDRHDQLGPVCS